MFKWSQLHRLRHEIHFQERRSAKLSFPVSSQRSRYKAALNAMAAQRFGFPFDHEASPAIRPCEW